jgi:DivIVA domain-containing protein
VDRDRIERRDFPTGRRGYDPAAVDEHLRRVADEFEARAHAPGVSMSDSTSEQVRLILAAAERGAAELRSTAGTEASEHVARVQTAADGMLSKLDALESELSRLLSALRTSGERLVEGLAELQSAATLGEPRPAGDATDPRGADLPSAAPPPAGASSVDLPGAATTPVGASSTDLPGAAMPSAGASSVDLPSAATSPPDASSAGLPGDATTPPVPAPADGDAAGRSPEHPPSRAKPGSGDRLDAAPEQAPSADSPSADSPSADSPSPDSPTPVVASPESPTRVAASPDSPTPAAESPDSPTPAAASPNLPGADSPSPVADGPASPSPDRPAPATDGPVSPQPARESAPHETPPLSAPGAPDWPAPAEALFDAPPAGDAPFAPAEPDEAGARLIALNMALGGSPRDDTRIFLEEHFEVPDIEALLDDVYARAGR